MALSSSPSPPCMGNPRPTPKVPSPPPLPPPSLLHKNKKPKPKAFRALCSAFRSFPDVITPITLKFHNLPIGFPAAFGHHDHSSRITGTFFGYGNGRVSFSMQESPKSVPFFLLELPLQTHVLLQKEMTAETARISLECEKRPEEHKTRLVAEPLWTMFCNGKKSGYGVRREARKEDLAVMELLDDVSVGEGVLPGISQDPDGARPEADRELGYLRAHFERVVGSKDYETLHMLGPERGPSMPQLTMFLVRL